MIHFIYKNKLKSINCLNVSDTYVIGNIFQDNYILELLKSKREQKN